MTLTDSQYRKVISAVCSLNSEVYNLLGSDSVLMRNISYRVVKIKTTTSEEDPINLAKNLEQLIVLGIVGNKYWVQTPRDHKNLRHLSNKLARFHHIKTVI